MTKTVVAPKPATKTEIVAALVEKTGLTKAQVLSVIDNYSELMLGSVGKGGAGVFTIPGIVKMKVIVKPATPARRGPNPFNKEEIKDFPAKPARRVVKAQPLKALKDAAATA